MPDQLQISLLALADKWKALAEEADRRGQPGGQQDNYPPGYWFGVKFGFAEAASGLRQLLAAKENSHDA